MFGRLGNQVFRASEKSTDALANVISNISNMKTVGYKKGEITFAEALNGEILKYESKDFSQGPLRRTAEPFDLAIEGKGFFEVELPNGVRAYTRVGIFHLSGDGELVTQEGYRVLPLIEQTESSENKIIKSDASKETKAGKFQVQASQVGMNLKVSTPKLIVPPHLTPEITKDGTIFGTDQETGEKTKLGRISLVTFNNPKGLESIGKGYYLETNNSGKPIEISSGPDSQTKIRQGFIESSNVEVAQEFMQLTQLKNLLTAQLKVLKAIDKIYENVHFTISRAV